VHSLVKLSRGKIHFESQENKGTYFKILLPLKNVPGKVISK
jgi:signal transduction histidine kinase